MKKFVIEIEETKAEAVVSLLATVNVKIEKPTEKKIYIRVIGQYGDEDRFIVLTPEQYNVLSWLDNCGYAPDFEEVDPEAIFEEI